jgi:hypothetical protein
VEVLLRMVGGEFAELGPLTRHIRVGPAVVVIERQDHPVLEPRFQELQYAHRTGVQVAVDVRQCDVPGRTVGPSGGSDSAK